MKVDFDNLRRQMMYAYSRLARSLNDAILKEDSDQYALPNGVYHGQEMNISGYVLIDKEDIQSDMDNLRSLIGTCAACYDDAAGLKDVYTGEKDMAEFNAK